MNYVQVTLKADEAVFGTIPCPGCGSVAEVTVKARDWQRYLRGVPQYRHMQTAFPYLSSTDRERLMTGICENCWPEVKKASPSPVSNVDVHPSHVLYLPAILPSGIVFDYENYSGNEKNVLGPAIEKLGYTNLGSWFSTEADSFGPLGRAITAIKDGQAYLLCYG